MKRFFFAAMLLVLPAAANAQLIEFDFQGNAGFGLLPGNEVGANIPIAANGDILSTAIGGEVDGGIVFDPVESELSIAFSFEGLNGGLLAAAASGIHLHLPDVLGDPFNSTGGIVYNLNSGTDPNVDVLTSLIADGATSGTVSAVIDVDPANVAALLDGEIYLNIHSQDFSSGELRGNLVAVPEPTTTALGVIAGLLSVAGVSRRQR